MSGPPGDRWEPWEAEVARRVAEGYDRLDLLTAVDRPEQQRIEVVIHLQRRSAGRIESLWGHTLLDRTAPRLDSLTPVLPAAAWHEREIAEMFGVDVAGHPDPRPLLLHGSDGPPPLRKGTPLVARIETPWPGASDETGRRRVAVPGLPPEWLERR